MALMHRVVGYDRLTDEARQLLDIPGPLMGPVKRIVAVPNDDPDAVWSYELSAAQAQEIARLIGGELEPTADFFLQAFADAQLSDRTGQ